MPGMLIAAVLAAAAASAAPNDAPPNAPSPYAIFGRARLYWEAQHYPGALRYVVAVRVVENGHEKVAHYHSSIDGYTGDIAVDAVSEEEEAHPYKPPGGFGFGYPGSGGGRALTPVDYLGVPVLAPNYGFGIGRTPPAQPPHVPTDAEIVAAVRAQFHDPDPRIAASAAPTATPTPGLREIATVVSRSRMYDISLEGIDAIDGEPAYHLRLRPLREPGRYRLRELWVDTVTFAPRKLIEGLNFVNGPGTEVPWSVTFVSYDGALYIDTETALAPMRYQRHHYSEASVSITKLQEVDAPTSDVSPFLPENGPLLMEEP